VTEILAHHDTGGPNAPTVSSGGYVDDATLTVRRCLVHPATDIGDLMTRGELASNPRPR
jgi:hypothetical protein